jgi:FlaG/FlaF family flagellin (archaellin)
MTLGCATHSYTITDRDGGNVASAGTLTAVQYNRLLNDASTGIITVGTAAPGCCEQLGRIRAWRHRLNIFRGSDLMWSGLVLNVDWTYDQVVVTGVDLFGLLDRRVPHQDMVFSGTDLTVIAEELIDDGLAPDDPGHEVTIMGPAMVTGGRSYDRDIGQTADHLRDLTDTGIDITVIGNRFIILPDNFGDVVGRLSDDDLPQGLRVTEDGAGLATRQIVAGSEDGDVLGSAGGTNAYYGLLEVYTEQTTITTDTAATESARARLAASAMVPVFIDTQDVTLAPTANVSMRALVPGWCVDITTDSTCRRITQRLKITGLKVSENATQEQVVLQVSATGETLEVN